jgi:drug/metabolite transporter (DMT)-like permease
VGDVFALLSAVCWAACNVSIGIGIRNSGASKGADNGAFLSILLTAVMAASLWAISGTRLGNSPMTARGIGWFAVAGALTIFVGRVFLYSSIRWLGAMRGASLKRLVPFFSVLLGAFVLGETLSRLLILGMTLIFAGFILLLMEARHRRGSAVSSDDRLRTNTGFLYGTVSALAYAAGNVARKHGVALLPQPAFGAMLGSLVGAALFVMTAPFAASYRSAIRSTFTSFNGWQFTAGILGSAGQILFFLAIDYSAVSRAAMIVSAEVFLTIAFTVLLIRDHEKVTLAVLGAAALGGLGTLVILVDNG